MAMKPLDQRRKNSTGSRMSPSTVKDSNESTGDAFTDSLLAGAQQRSRIGQAIASGTAERPRKPTGAPLVKLPKAAAKPKEEFPGETKIKAQIKARHEQVMVSRRLKEQRQKSGY